MSMKRHKLTDSEEKRLAEAFREYAIAMGLGPNGKLPKEVKRQIRARILGGILDDRRSASFPPKEEKTFSWSASVGNRRR
ncbi:conserved hypothetical protein [Xenorhabdus bovienii str. puntauvense]|uniref:Uncharacterized protein n=2 Tax=Xenorhabdus bovienii TaxID=40576 RepID=A0A077N3M9_XENBV|nr:conserved hypothetical protein [Xenorhabdus bovienii str. puntauvense]